ncbi:FBP domain-containing protein [Leekyejoonella antrihumi]|nr:FBP domain-containing protein [Leekyejoonella antrihumi]
MIRDSFINATRGQTKRAELPDLSAPDWSSLDYFGWPDARRPLLAYVAMEIDDELVCVLLRKPESTSRRRILCAWCQDVHEGDSATFYVAPRAGASGRQGNTIGTVICSDFRCSANARRAPKITEMNSTDDAERQFWINLRVAELRDRSTRFIRQLMRD